MRQHDVAEEIVLHAQGLVQKFLHYDCAGAAASSRNAAAYVAELRRRDAVDGPGHRVTPVEPSPPERQRLQE